MRLVFKKTTSNKVKARLKKRARIRRKVFGTDERPRLSVFRSAKHIYAQIVDDASGKTVVEASTRTVKTEGSQGSRSAAKTIGAELAKRAKAKKIVDVVFDRSGYLYHGRIKELADAAREAGLKF